MINAYDRIYLEKARVSLGRMLDYAVFDLKYELSDFWEMFLSSTVSLQFEQGVVSIIAGRSGAELALMVTGKDQCYERPVYSENKSDVYWTGWALSYYQWKYNCTFSQITELIPIEKICMMYSPYHEMDIRHFCDRLTEIYLSKKKETNLKKRRMELSISQSKLAVLSGVPLRTIQQYEQGQKNINKARAEYVIALSKALYCEPKVILELELPKEE